MRFFFGVLGVLLIAATFQDIFEAVLLPRRKNRAWRFLFFFYLLGWKLWRARARRLPPGARRENFIAIFGPLSMMLLFTS